MEIFNLDPDSAPSLDGFPSSFFQEVWDDIEFDIVFGVQYCFHSCFIQPGLNLNFMVLFPKEPNAINIEKICPIILINFLLYFLQRFLEIGQ